MGHHGEHLSRRGFLQSTAASAAASQLGEPTHVAFKPAANPRQISTNLFVLEDTCNVYLIKQGSSGLLIDFGSGAILHHLPALGITTVDGILHTHHHRDQAQGDHLAVARDIPIFVPEQEQQYFTDAENFWRNRRIFELYYVRNDFFSLTINVPVKGPLRDHETFGWKDHGFYIQPTPGHTPGSITLLTDVDGRKVAFAGDLMHSPGKVQTLYDLQYAYEEHEGADLSAYSLAELSKHAPDLFCPSHGHEMTDPVPAMRQAVSKLNEWFDYWKSWGGSFDQTPRRLTRHVVAHYQTMSSFYAIISDSGKALFIDYGGPSWNAFYAFRDSVGGRNRLRFLEHSIENLRAHHGLQSVDVAIPSHMHDDHLSGLPYLSRHHGTKIWCFENFVDILENPRGHNLGCTLAEPIRVDRVIRHRETFRWEEFEFTAVHSPGHTDFQMALFATIDGVRLGFTGDAFFHDADRPFQIRHNLIYRNRVKLGDHLKSVVNLLEFRPQILCPGHGEPFLLDLDMVESFRTKLTKQDVLIRELVADADTDLGLDPSWIEIYPYQSAAARGDTRAFEIRARNHRQRAVELQVALALPAGWRCAPKISKFTVPARESAQASVSITIPSDFQATQSRIAIAADVMCDGEYRGQIAEAVIDLSTAAG